MQSRILAISFDFFLLWSMDEDCSYSLSKNWILYKNYIPSFPQNSPSDINGIFPISTMRDVASAIKEMSHEKGCSYTLMWSWMCSYKDFGKRMLNFCEQTYEGSEEGSTANYADDLFLGKFIIGDQVSDPLLRHKIRVRLFLCVVGDATLPSLGIEHACGLRFGHTKTELLVGSRFPFENSRAVCGWLSDFTLASTHFEQLQGRHEKSLLERKASDKRDFTSNLDLKYQNYWAVGESKTNLVEKSFFVKGSTYAASPHDPGNVDKFYDKNSRMHADKIQADEKIWKKGFRIESLLRGNREESDSVAKVHSTARSELAASFMQNKNSKLSSIKENSELHRESGQADVINIVKTVPPQIPCEKRRTKGNCSAPTESTNSATGNKRIFMPEIPCEKKNFAAPATRKVRKTKNENYSSTFGDIFRRYLSLSTWIRRELWELSLAFLLIVITVLYFTGSKIVELISLLIGDVEW